MSIDLESRSAKQQGSQCTRSRGRPINNSEEDGDKENQNGGQIENVQQFNNCERSRANELKLTMRRNTANKYGWEMINKTMVSLSVQEAVSIDIPAIQIFPKRDHLTKVLEFLLN